MEGQALGSEEQQEIYRLRRVIEEQDRALAHWRRAVDSMAAREGGLVTVLVKLIANLESWGPLAPEMGNHVLLVAREGLKEWRQRAGT